ncbi:DUF4012 domain-containing protein [Cellulomonas hominis]
MSLSPGRTAAPSSSDPGEPTGAPEQSPAPVPPGDVPRRSRDRRPRSRARRRVLIVLVVLVVLLVGVAGWLGLRAVQAARALQEVQDGAAGIEAQVAAGDTDGLHDEVSAVLASAQRARAATADPVWSLGELLPVVGDDLTAVRVVATAAGDVADAGQPAVDGVLTALEGSSLQGPDGQLDLSALVASAPSVQRAVVAVQRAGDQVAELDPAGLVDRLRGPVEQAQDLFARSGDRLAEVAQLADVVEPMLGAAGERTYLLLSLNSAEVRAAGGIVGAVTVMHVQDGLVRLGEQRSTADLPPLDQSVLPLTDGELTMHTDRLGRWIQDTMLTPDFPRSAALVQALWQQATGEAVDGVIATDAVAASYLLGDRTVRTNDGTVLDGSSLLAGVLYDSNVRLGDPTQADQLYADVAASMFRMIGDGTIKQLAAAEGLLRASEEGRLRLWSADPDEQRQIAATSLGAAFLSGGADGAAGLFLADGTAGKLDYFLSTSATAEQVSCTAQPSAVLRVDLAYDPPADVAALPSYVVGTGASGLPIGSLATNLLVYAPVGGTITGLWQDDAAIGGVTATEGGRDAESVTSWLAPGGRVSYRVELALPADSVVDGQLHVLTTPTLTGPGSLVADCGTSAP